MNESTEDAISPISLDELRAANPFPADGSAPQPITSQSALFEEIIMHKYQPDGVAADAPVAQTSWWKRRMFIPVMAAFMALVGFGAIVGIGALGAAPSAIATISTASENTAAMDSGAVTITIDLREMDGEVEDAQVVLGYRYDFENYEVRWAVSGGPDSVPGPTTHIQHKGILYEQVGDDPTFRAVPFAEVDLLKEFGLDRTSVTVDALVPLLEASEDFGEVAPTDAADGVRQFRGTIATEDLVAIEADQRPAGLSLFASDDLDGLPTTMVLDAVLQDGLLHTFTLNANGDTPNGRADFTITTEYRNFGEPQNIEAPAEFEQPEVIGELLELSADEQRVFDEYLAIVEELEARRPGLCANLAPFGEITDMTQAVEDFEAWVQCFVDNDEPQMASATLSNPGYEMFTGPDAAQQAAESDARAALLATLQQDLDERRPGLCDEKRPTLSTDENGNIADGEPDFEPWFQCFIDAGEPEYAEAVRGNR